MREKNQVVLPLNLGIRIFSLSYVFSLQCIEKELPHALKFAFETAPYREVFLFLFDNIEIKIHKRGKCAYFFDDIARHYAKMLVDSALAYSPEKLTGR